VSEEPALKRIVTPSLKVVNPIRSASVRKLIPQPANGLSTRPRCFCPRQHAICRYQEHYIAKPGRPRNRSELLYELREGLRTPVISGYGTNEIRTLFCIMLAKPEPAGPRRAPALRGGPWPVGCAEQNGRPRRATHLGCGSIVRATPAHNAASKTAQNQVKLRTKQTSRPSNPARCQRTSVRLQNTGRERQSGASMWQGFPARLTCLAAPLVSACREINPWNNRAGRKRANSKRRQARRCIRLQSAAFDILATYRN